MTLMSVQRLLRGAAGNGGGVGSVGGSASTPIGCCSCCCRRKQTQCCGDVVVKVAIAALVCIALCYACFIVETKRFVSAGEVIAAQQQQQQQQQDEMLKERFLVVHDDASPVDEFDGSGEGDVIIGARRQYADDGLPSLLLFHSADDDVENASNAIKRYSTPTRANTSDIIEIIGDSNDFLHNDEMMVAKPDAHADATKVLPSSGDWMHRIPLQSGDDNDEVGERRLFDNAPSAIEWITASVESGERYFPQELGFGGAAAAKEDATITVVGEGRVGGVAEVDVDDSQPSAEEIILTNYDSDDFMPAQPAVQLPPTLPLALPLPPPPSVFMTPVPPLALDGILETLFGQMASMIRTPPQQQQQDRENSLRLRNFNC